MAHRSHLLLLSAALAILLAGCASPQKRIDRNPALFASLPPQDQVLVQRGEVRKGMNMDAVFIAWGRPDRIRREVAEDDETLTWLYLGYRSESVPRWTFHPRHGGYCDPYFGIPVYDPVYVSIPYLDKSATFRDNVLIGYETGLY